jgi:hypothetical protein
MTPFYEKAKELWQKTQNAQILKGLQKYPEPFNPHSWTPEQLLNHALEETVDLTHYLVGLKELLDAKDEEINSLKKEIAGLKRVNKLVSSLPKKSPFEEQAMLVPRRTTPYDDLDDQ